MPGAACCASRVSSAWSGKAWACPPKASGCDGWRWSGADGASLRLDVEHALLRWPGLSGWRPRLPGLRVEQVALAWQPAAASSDDDSAALDWTSLRETLAWLPEQIHLERFHLDLPCPAGRCEQDGGLDIGRPSGALFPLAAQLRLQQEAQQAQLDAQLFEEPTGWRLRRARNSTGRRC